jgi:queuine tRNA-ribosyltransferase
VLGFTVPLLPDEAPRHLLGIGEIDDLLVGVGLGIDLFDCAIPTRLARHGTALAPNPGGRFRIDLTKATYAADESPVVEGCPCEGCTRHTRAYLHYLARNKDLTGTRLLTLHNLSYMESLMREVRHAIALGRYGVFREEVMAGQAPWDCSTRASNDEGKDPQGVQR